MPRIGAPDRRTVLAGLAACAGARIAPARAEGEKGLTDKEVVLGTMGALTGPLAADGLSLQDGTAAALEAANAAGGIGGRRLRLLSEDNAYSAPQALAAVRRMMAGSGIFALLNGHSTPQLAAVLPYLSEQKVTIFGGYGGLPEWYDPPREGLFGLYPFGEDQGRALGRWAARDGARKVLVLHIEGNVYQRSGQAAANGVREVAKDATVELQGIKFGTSDYAPVAIRIAQTRPDALVVLLSEVETVLLTRETRAQGMAVAAYAWAPIVTEGLIVKGAANVEGLKATAMTVAPDADTAAVREYRADLARLHPNEAPEFFSLFSYGCTKVFLEAMRRVKGPLSHATLYEAIYTLKDYDTGIIPPVTFSAQQHHGTRTLFQATVKGGRWVVGDRISGAPA